MFKNQLQELAQRSCFNLPAYSCIREGPDHAPRFKATVNFNGEVFESPTYFSTLRHAEHAAAEVALNTLSRRGPPQSLAARILDETGVYKNLLQETAQRAGVPLPIYTTVRSGPGHLPVFTCTVGVGGMIFTGEAAKTKKQAEKNAAMTAWSSLKQYAKQGGTSATLLESEVTEEQEQNFVARALARAHGKDERSVLLAQQSTPSRTRLLPGGGHSGQYHPGSWLLDANSETSQSHRFMHSSQHHSNGMVLGNGHSYRSLPRRMPPGAGTSRDVPGIVPSRSMAGNMPRVIPTQLRSIPTVIRRDRHDISVPLEEHQRDEDEWLRGGSSESKQDDRRELRDSEASSSSFSSMWSNPSSSHSRSPWWGMSSPASSGFDGMPGPPYRAGYGMAQPVRIRSVVAVSAAPPPRRPEPRVENESDSNDGEAATRQVLSQLSL
ncbi:double-stranded RNA-binding protein 5-like [Selaginella moellendorffii]|nr:double-stranded RNA-binding protein 5-like [Selaginella moellendorffii]|eukprot:XP_024539615.1 double-stranded RNA-binding protein 5-like [Selaginella moellendorffii]